VRTHLELKRRGDLLEELAFMDTVTSIHNRRRFEGVLDEEWRRASRSDYWLSLLMMDIDFFKSLNDNCGHAAGDDCLRRLAQTLAASLVRAGDFLARYGGDEFVAILPGADLDAAANTAKMIRRAVDEADIRHDYSPVSEKVTISIGVASAKPSVDTGPRVLMETADRMLYRAKKCGRDRVECSCVERFR
jgi:diguanylate cyclase (GGDEF)-like protein